MLSAPSDAETRATPRDASSVTDTEEGRAFFQKRLSVFGLALFVLAGGSWVVRTLTGLVGGFGEYDVLAFTSILHFWNGGLGGVLWGVTRSGRRTGSVLHAFDIGTTLGLITIWSLAGVSLPNPTVGGFVSLLSFVVGTLARAIVVPSTARRTAVLGLIGVTLLMGLAATRQHAAAMDIGAVATANWAISATVIATLASHTIFGLRREAAKARVLGQYTLEEKLGEGGMGSVWRASHALLRRPTAVKLLAPGRQSEGTIKRFEREVQLTARLTHPNTVAIYDYGRTREGVFYYAMELLDGLDLERLVSEHGPLPPERVVHVIAQVCGALAEAHDLGLIHRDVKPANILLSPRAHEHEYPKIVDFGLVKPLEARTELTTVSARNTITGTPLYMSPEAIEAPDKMDGRSDLYALGAVAWFLLVGRPVFDGTSVVAVCSKHMHAPPQRPSEALGAAVPEALEEVVLACLAKRPDDRPADARVLRQRLEATGLGATWTAERAAEWWLQRNKSLPPPSKEDAQTMALDLGKRA